MRKIIHAFNDIHDCISMILYKLESICKKLERIEDVIKEKDDESKYV